MFLQWYNTTVVFVNCNTIQNHFNYRGCAKAWTSCTSPVSLSHETQCYRNKLQHQCSKPESAEPAAVGGRECLRCSIHQQWHRRNLRQDSRQTRVYVRSEAARLCWLLLRVLPVQPEQPVTTASEQGKLWELRSEHKTSKFSCWFASARNSETLTTADSWYPHDWASTSLPSQQPAQFS